MSRCVILGDGLSGRAALRLANRLGYEAKILCDDPESHPLAAVEEAEAELAGAELIVTSPGVKPSASLLWQTAEKKCRAGGCAFISELEFGSRHWPGEVLAITGTNGKTTTTELTCALLQAIEIDARPAGNIGIPLADLAADWLEGKIDAAAVPVAVVEVSSFQLERCDTFAPHAAALLNLESDHIDRYPGGFAEYAAVKQRIFDRVQAGNRIYGLSMASPTPRRVTLYGEAMLVDGEVLIDLGNTALSAPHNRENLAAAVELCLRVASRETVLSPAFRYAVHTFRPGRHRLEKVCERDEVTYVNDSKSTNPASTLAALRAVRPPVVLLLGGLDKGMDFTPLAGIADRVRSAVLYGECRETIAAALPDGLRKINSGNDFDAAVAAAMGEGQPGDTVLLSPACASMDLFRNYQERGDRFCELVKQ